MLFVRGNHRLICPLVGWSQGYFRFELDEQGHDIVVDYHGRHITGIRDGELIGAADGTDLESGIRFFGLTTEDGRKVESLQSNQQLKQQPAMSAEKFMMHIRQLIARRKSNQPAPDQGQKKYAAPDASAPDENRPSPPPGERLTASTGGHHPQHPSRLGALVSVSVGLVALVFFRARPRLSCPPMRRRFWWKRLIGLCLVVGFWPISAFPFYYYVVDGKKLVWLDPLMLFTLHPVSFPDGSAWNLNAQYAMSDWNEVIGSGFDFYVRTQSSDWTNHSNRINSVVWAPGSRFDSPNVLAVTFLRRSGRYLIDTDVWFNVDFLWVPDLNVSGGRFSFRGVARHEFGHALGLYHEDRNRVATMYTYYTVGSNVEGLHADDMYGSRFLYPGPGEDRDPHVSGWTKRDSNPWPPSVPVMLPPSRIRRGQRFTLEVSFGNRGNRDVACPLGFYLSADRYISGSDRSLAEGFVQTDAGSFATLKFMLTIPSNVRPGSYYVGVLLDGRSEIAESAEWNNALAFGPIVVEP